MKIPNSKMTVWTVALLSLALAQAPKAAADDATKAPANYSQNADPSQSTMTAPADYNRASGIIGLEIRNQNNEKLGRIRDVVFDLNSERVSYVVMGAPKGRWGLAEKYLAIPLSALKPSGNSHYLLLNADKAKIAAATGFERDNLPPVGNQMWGAEPFWQSDSDKSSYAPEKPAEIPPVNTAPPAANGPVGPAVRDGVPARAGEPPSPVNPSQE